MLKLPKKEWLTRFDGTPLESISEWVRYYYISPVDYSYNDDGTIIKIDDVVVIVDLGTLDWTYANSVMITSNTLAVASEAQSEGGTNYVYCSKYKAKATRGNSSSFNDKECGLNTDGNRIIIKDSNYTDATAFKQAMSGVELMYIKVDSPL